MAVYTQQRGIACRRAADLTRDNANQRYAVRLDPSVSTDTDALPTATLTRAEADVLSVDGADVTAAITVDDDLSSVATPRLLNVAITGGTLAGATATVVVTGTNAGGNAQTQTLNFTAANVGTPQTSTGAYATLTTVTAAGFTAGTLDITALATLIDEVFGEYQTFDKSAIHVRNKGTMILRASQPYVSTLNGQGVIAGYQAGEVRASGTLGTGFGVIIGGGTESINGADVDVLKVYNPDQIEE